MGGHPCQFGAVREERAERPQLHRRAKLHLSTMANSPEVRIRRRGIKPTLLFQFDTISCKRLKASRTQLQPRSPEDHDSQGRKGYMELVRAAVPGRGLGRNSSEVALAAAAVKRRVGV